MGLKGATTDLGVASVAARQHGVITTAQLAQVGISADAARKRAGNGRLHRVHRGVYAVGHPRLSPEGRWMAAVLACGEGAVLSHRSAAALWGLLKPVDGLVAVTIPTGAGRGRRAGIRLHRRPALEPAATTRRRGIPVTTPARTLADLRRELAPELWRRAVRQAEVLGQRTGLAGATAPTRSELEDRFLALCAHHRLPAPEVNVRVGSYEVDFLWRRQRLVVETDGYRFHRGAQAFEDDHRRDLALRAQGYDVLRFTYGQVTTSSRQVADAVAAALRS